MSTTFKFQAFALRLTAFIVVAALGMACTSRERRPIVTTGKPPTTGPVPTATPVPGSTGAQPQPGSDQPQVNPEVLPPGATSTPVPGGTDVVPGDEDSATDDSSTGMLEIVTKLDDGRTVTLQWDGKSFQGNERWELQGL